MNKKVKGIAPVYHKGVDNIGKIDRTKGKKCNV